MAVMSRNFKSPFTLVLSKDSPYGGRAWENSTHLLANKGAQWDVLQGPDAPAHVLCPIELQPRPGKHGYVPGHSTHK